MTLAAFICSRNCCPKSKIFFSLRSDRATQQRRIYNTDSLSLNLQVHFLRVLISEVLRTGETISGLVLNAGFLTETKGVAVFFSVRCYNFLGLLYSCFFSLAFCADIFSAKSTITGIQSFRVASGSTGMVASSVLS